MIVILQLSASFERPRRVNVGVIAGASSAPGLSHRENKLTRLTAAAA
jgi:hypothetical protein